MAGCGCHKKSKKQIAKEQRHYEEKVARLALRKALIERKKKRRRE